MDLTKFPNESEEIITWGINEYTRLVSEKELVVEHELFNVIGPRAKQRGYLEKDEFLMIGRWKSPRPVNNYLTNSDEIVREITGIGLAPSRSEEVRVQVIRILDGVGLRVASAILTVVYPEKYGVLDVRAWRILHKWGKVERDKLKSEKVSDWINYLNILTDMAKKYQVRPRDIDMALYAIDKSFVGKI
ncbi:MAG: hypothetical protein ACXAEU_11845 [Candidatus Hodarchaeales archaeon]